ncbi:unnamed protein product [Penicillium salamii]|uniref:Uncharacterized protein n=1 Tax=Penicillium salamii TaxID=1612424 RepID=A0A9W4I844_9EURO|nr:unnamed protein product [Penicillium salamii]
MYTLLGEIIKRVTHQSWGEVLQSRVLSMVGLSETTVLGPEIPAESIALPYVVIDDKNQWRIGDLELKDGQLMSLVGGIRSMSVSSPSWRTPPFILNAGSRRSQHRSRSLAQECVHQARDDIRQSSAVSHGWLVLTEEYIPTRSNVHDMLKWGNAIMSSVNGDTDYPLHDISKILFGHTFINKSFTFDQLYTLGFGKVTLLA